MEPASLVDNAMVLMLTPIVIGLTQVSKALRVPSSFAPLVTVLLGVAASLAWFEGPWRQTTLTGVVIGLTAGGLYSGVTSSQTSVEEVTARRALTAKADQGVTTETTTTVTAPPVDQTE